MEYVYKFYLSDAHGVSSEIPFREVALPEPLEQIHVGKSVELPDVGDGVAHCQFRITRVESDATVTKVPMTLAVRVEVVRLHQTSGEFHAGMRQLRATRGEGA
ncbi:MULTISPECIES: hypothetical protein [unclassified Caballeronia]|jgi:hypothetical protein|uniref:hypothetical protein n=1 Tax=unclassified Caballeronia TaxID=2646786 RepID=UPI003ECDF582